jgi:hypothetical protein
MLGERGDLGLTLQRCGDLTKARPSTPRRRRPPRWQLDDPCRRIEVRTAFKIGGATQLVSSGLKDLSQALGFRAINAFRFERGVPQFLSADSAMDA